MSTTKPAIATAVPVKALRSEITTGMSAPPIGRTIVTPKTRAPIRATTRRSVQDGGVELKRPAPASTSTIEQLTARIDGDGRQEAAARQDDRLALESSHELGRGDRATR